MKIPVKAVFILVIFQLTFPVFAQKADGLLSGLEAYSRNDWPAAVLFFRKTVSVPETSTADAWYWLIMSEISGGWHEQALKDADSFIARFPASAKYADVLYQRGRALYQLQRREESIKQMNAFYQDYPSNPLASSALYWISESLYDMGYFEDALLLYDKILSDYPMSPKREASAYRIALIEQRSREYELLRLLKETHEAALRAADEFERKNRNNEQTLLAYQKRIGDLTKNTRYEDIENELNRLTVENAELRERVRSLESAAETGQPLKQASSTSQDAMHFNTPDNVLEEIRRLKEKAQIIQQTIDSAQGAVK